MCTKMTKSSVCFLIVAVMAAWCVWSTPAAEAKDKLTLGFAHVSMTAPYYVAMQKNGRRGR